MGYGLFYMGDNMPTINELKAQLVTKNIPFPDNATEEQLTELLARPAAPAPPPPPTPDIPRGPDDSPKAPAPPPPIAPEFVEQEETETHVIVQGRKIRKKERPLNHVPLHICNAANKMGELGRQLEAVKNELASMEDRGKWLLQEKERLEKLVK